MHQVRELQLKPLAQAVTLACASITANSVYADACTAVGTTIIAASTSDSCLLGNFADGGVDTGVTVNTGVVLGRSSSTTGVRVSAGFAAGAINNNGTILGSSDSTAYGIFLDSGSSLSGGISNSGTIRGKATTTSTTPQGFGIFASSATINGGITNNTGGLIIGSGWGTSSSNGGAGIGLQNSSVTGGINNSGTIRGMSTSSSTGTYAGFGIRAISSSSIAGGITNNSGGLIEGIGYERGVGIYLDNSSVDNITNDGRIHGSSTTGGSKSYGIYLLNGASNSGSIFNNAGGQITGSGNNGSSGFGIALSASSITGDINNSGTIKGFGLSSNPGFGIHLSNNSSITGGIINSGTIKGSAGSGLGTGIFISASSISGGITNNAGGLISGTTYGINIINPTAAVSVTNNGIISGGTAAINVQNGTLNLSGTVGRVVGSILNSNLNVVNSFTSGGNITGFLNVTVTDGGTFNLGHNITATTFTVGQGVSGMLDVGTAAANDAGAFTLAAGATFKTTINSAAMDDAGSLTVTGASTIDPGAMVNVSTGLVNLVDGTTYLIINSGSGTTGAVAGVTDDNAGFDFTASLLNGDLTLTANLFTGALVVNDGQTVNSFSNSNFASITVGAGVSGVLNQTAGSITTPTVTVNNGGTFTQSGTGTLTVTDINTNATGMLTLNNVSVNDGGSITGNIAAVAGGSVVFAGAATVSGTVGAGQSFGTINVNGAVTETAATGILNAAAIVIGAGGTLTLVNQGTGAIDGAAAGQGSLAFAGNYDTDAALGGTTSLAAITVNDGVTLTLDQSAAATTVTVGQGTSGVLNQSAGTVTTDALTVNTGGSYTQSGTGVLNATNVSIAAGGTLTLANQGTGNIDGAAAGQGTLVFAGNYDTDAALGGATSLAAITVNDGVTLGLDQNAEATSVTVGQGTSGVLNQSAGTVTADTLSVNAGGSYTQSGTGALTATDINTDAAGTLTLNSLTVNDGGSISGNITGVAGGGSSVVFSGAATVSGTVGAGQSFGTIRVNGAVMETAATGILNADAITIAAGASLTLANQGTGAIDGAAAGQGTLVFAGNYDTDAALGGTTGLAAITVNNGATLTLDQAASATALTIAGIVNKSGSAAMTTATTVNDAGLMKVLANFTHTGDLTVGQGTSGTLNITNTTVDVNGNFTLAAGATLMTTVNSGATDDAGSITVTGTTTVSADAKVDVMVTAGAVVASGTTYKIIDGPTGGGGVTAPLTITDDSAELDFFASADGDDLTLTAALAGTLPGIISGIVGEEFSDSFSANGAAVFANLVDLLDNDAELTAAFAGITTAEDFDKALVSLAPDMSGAIIDATTAVGRSAVVTIINRLVALRTAGTSNALTGMSAGDPYRDGGMWLQGFGSTIDQDNRQGIAGFDADTAGLTFGADTPLTDNFRLGAAFSYSSTDVDTKGSANNVDIDNYQGTVYASLKSGEQYFDASFSYAQNSYTGTRAVTVGALKRTARADYDADQTIIQGTWGRTFNFGDGLYANPFIGLNYVNLDIDAYSETGAGAANLVVAKADHETLESSLGLSLRKEMKTGRGTMMIPEIHASWRHEFLDDEQTNTSTFTGAGASFATRGFNPVNNSANIGVAFSAYLKNNIDIQVRYDYEAKSDYDGHSGIATIRYNF